MKPDLSLSDGTKKVLSVVGVTGLARLLTRQLPAAVKQSTDAAAAPLDALGRPLPQPEKPRASSGTTLPRGASWVAHDRRGGRAAGRRLWQFIQRGLMICASCETVRPLGEIRLYRTAPDGTLLLVEDPSIGTDARAVCIHCIPDDGSTCPLHGCALTPESGCALCQAEAAVFQRAKEMADVADGD